MIRTVLKDIDEEEIRHAQCHEHLFVEDGASARISDVLLMEDAALALKELEEYKSAGGSLVVDAQPGYFGRMAEKLGCVSQKSGVHIVASTGFHKMAFCDFPHLLEAMDAEALAGVFIKELTDGMAGSRSAGLSPTGYRAGIIKTALDAGGVGAGMYSRLFAAAASAQKATGAPILCHIEQGADALEAVGFFTANGVPPEKIIICHLDRARYDARYHAEVAKTGVYLDYDSVNRLKYLTHEQELSLIEWMIENGFAGKIMLSLDTTRARLKNYGGDMGLSYLLETYIGMMRARGISRADIARMTCENAKKALRFG